MKKGWKKKGYSVRYDPRRRRWRATVTNNGPRETQDFNDCEAATLWAKEQHKKRMQQVARVFGPNMLLAELIADFLNSDRTTDERDSRSLPPLVPTIGMVHINEIADWHIKKHIKHRLEQGMANKTINHETHALRHLLNVAVMTGLLPSAPKIAWKTYELPTFSRTRVLTGEEEIAIRNALVMWARDAFDFALLTGVRSKQLFHIKAEHIDLENRVLLAPRSTNNRKRFAEVPLCQEAIEIVRRNYHNFERCGYLFANTQGKRLRKLRQQWLDAIKRAGIKNICWHDLRHTFATRLAEAGVPREIIAAILGDTPKVALIYVNISREKKREWVDKVCRKSVANGDRKQRGLAGHSGIRKSKKKGDSATRKEEK